MFKVLSNHESTKRFWEPQYPQVPLNLAPSNPAPSRTFCNSSTGCYASHMRLLKLFNK